MPVISNLDFNSLTAKINEYSRLEQVGAAIVGVFAVYVLHSVWPLGGMTSLTVGGIVVVCLCLESHQAYPRTVFGEDDFDSVVVQCNERT